VARPSTERGHQPASAYASRGSVPIDGHSPSVALHGTPFASQPHANQLLPSVRPEASQVMMDSGNIQREIPMEDDERMEPFAECCQRGMQAVQTSDSNRPFSSNELVDDPYGGFIQQQSQQYARGTYYQQAMTDGQFFSRYGDFGNPQQYEERSLRHQPVAGRQVPSGSGDYDTYDKYAHPSPRRRPSINTNRDSARIHSGAGPPVSQSHSAHYQLGDQHFQQRHHPYSKPPRAEMRAQAPDERFPDEDEEDRQAFEEQALGPMSSSFIHLP
jgi:hypothetical protein